MRSSAYYKKLCMNMIKYLLVICFGMVFLLPFIIMVTTSLKTNADAFALPVKLLPTEVIWQNYPEALDKIPYLTYMKNTIFITFFSILGQLIATPLVAYSLGKIKWKGAKYISALIMATMMIPYTVTMIPLYKIWTSLDLAGTYLPLIAPTFFGSAFYIIIMRQFFSELPDSLFEAAEIDGAGELRRYMAIALPLSKPALTTVGIYAFITAWSDYLAPLIYINKTEKLTLSLGLQGYLSQYSVDWTHLMAATTMFVIPVVIFFLIFQRNFVEGVTSSGIKG